MENPGTATGSYAVTGADPEFSCWSGEGGAAGANPLDLPTRENKLSCRVNLKNFGTLR